MAQQISLEQWGIEARRYWVREEQHGSHITSVISALPQTESEGWRTLLATYDEVAELVNEYGYYLWQPEPGRYRYTLCIAGRQNITACGPSFNAPEVARLAARISGGKYTYVKTFTQYGIRCLDKFFA